MRACHVSGVDKSWELAATNLWKDVLGVHSRTPLHCLVGGGDQLYQDGFFQAHLPLRPTHINLKFL